MPIKFSILLGLLFIILYIIIGIVFDGNHALMLPLLLSCIFLITIYVAKRRKDWRLIDCFLLILPLFLLFLVAGYCIEDYSRAIQYLIFIPISSCLSYLYIKTKKVFIIPVSLVSFYYVGFYLFTTIFTYVANRDAERNMNLPNITLVDSSGTKIDLFREKVIVLDFWSTTCGICFEKFPDFQSVSDKYKSNKNVEIYAVNFPLKNDRFAKTTKVLDSIGYTFSKLYAKSAKEIEDSLHFNTFPHLIIVKDGKIRYDGMLETDKNTMIFSVESEIEKLLNE